MSIGHRLFIGILTLVVILTLVALSWLGYSYYNLPLEERFFNQAHVFLKPGGIWGHGFGIIGTLSIILGITLYMVRKRMRSLARFGVLKYWLEFHIFLCTLGSVFVLFHTSFKFGGIISIGFWSMAIVWTSGVVGRFIYLQIPRTIEGRELSLQEVKNIKEELDLELMNKYQIDFSTIKTSKFSKIKLDLIAKNISGKDLKKVKRLIKNQKKISKRIERLSRMQNLFKYWHVAHLPFALIMLIIMVIHVGVSLFFGYKWIF